MNYSGGNAKEFGEPLGYNIPYRHRFKKEMVRKEIPFIKDPIYMDSLNDRELQIFPSISYVNKSLQIENFQSNNNNENKKSKKCFKSNYGKCDLEETNYFSIKKSLYNNNQSNIAEDCKFKNQRLNYLTSISKLNSERKMNESGYFKAESLLPNYYQCLMPDSKEMDLNINNETQLSIEKPLLSPFLQSKDIILRSKKDIVPQSMICKPIKSIGNIAQKKTSVEYVEEKDEEDTVSIESQSIDVSDDVKCNYNESFYNSDNFSTAEESDFFESSAWDQEMNIENSTNSSTPIMEMLLEVQQKFSSESNRPQEPFIYSLFPNVVPVLRFVREGESIIPLTSEFKKYLKWRNSTITPNVVKRVVKRSGFKLKQKSGPNWIGYFGKHLKPSAFKSIQEHQKINHLPGSFQIGRKDRLWRNVTLLANRNSKSGGKEFNFLPKTYCLPSDYKFLEMAWNDDESRRKAKWIIKPPASARGIGVKVISKWSQVPRKTPAVVQSYLTRPFLINDSKFDLRIYVAVTSIDPLRIYIYRDGLVRFASHKYSKSSKNISNRFIHLTNYSVNKKSDNYTSNSDYQKCQGHKWTLKALWKHFEELKIDYQVIWEKIKDSIIKTIISVESHINSNIKMYCAHKNCAFELFGFDVILDHKLHPWILEVNVSPSLHSNSPLDIEVKSGLISDLFNLVGFQLYEADDQKNSNTILNKRASLSAPCRSSRSTPNQTLPNSSSTKNDKSTPVKMHNEINSANNNQKKKLRKMSTAKLMKINSTNQINNSKMDSEILMPTDDHNSDFYKIPNHINVFQRRGFYCRTLTPNEKQKHKFYVRKGFYDDSQLISTITEKLTIDDARILIESIDEFSRAGDFEIAYPILNRKSKESVKSVNDIYFNYIANNAGSIYYNCLLREYSRKHVYLEETGVSMNPIIRLNESGYKTLNQYSTLLLIENKMNVIWEQPKFGLTRNFSSSSRLNVSTISSN